MPIKIIIFILFTIPQLGVFSVFVIIFIFREMQTGIDLWLIFYIQKDNTN